MTLIIKELVVRSTIVSPHREINKINEQQLKEELIKACTNRLKRHFKNKKER